MSKADVQNQSQIIPNSPFFQPYFLICKSCFWCASCMFSAYKIRKCPLCNDTATTESIPIFNRESSSLTMITSEV